MLRNMLLLLGAIAAFGVQYGQCSQSKDEPDPEVIYCNFDKMEDCGYNSIDLGYLLDEYIFKNTNENKAAFVTGPHAEHSTGSSMGKFAMLDVYGMGRQFRANEPKNATLQSGTYPAAPHYCIQFWYSMRGRHIYGLDVFVEVGSGHGTPSWSKRGDQIKEWELGQFELDVEYTSNGFQLQFVGYTNYYYPWSGGRRGEYSNIAIDDVYAYKAKCSDIPKCPKDAVTNTAGGVTSCYTVHTQPKTWKEAFDTCRRQGATSALVSIESQEEQDFLVKLINGNADYKAAGESTGFFTSGNDIDTEGSFSWTDTGVQRDLDYTNWRSGQPNNVADNQHCLVLEYPAEGYLWGDEDCDSQRAFICEVYNV